MEEPERLKDTEAEQLEAVDGLAVRLVVDAVPERPVGPGEFLEAEVG